MTKRFNQYLGKAGHLAVMAELLVRGWNVAIPEVDVGDDIFVVQDYDGTLRRVQVKTSTSINRKDGFSAQFNIPLRQLRDLKNLPIYYAFITRRTDLWTKPVIIRQDYLLDHFDANKVGSLTKNDLILYFSYSQLGNSVTCSGQDFSRYVCDYSDFSLIEH